MKKIFATIICFVMLAGAALPSFAQTYRGQNGRRAAQERRQDSRRANNDRYNYDRRQDDRSVWSRHRDILTVAAGTGAGAAIGAVSGGKRGALIGALIGAGGSALYTYGIRDRDNDDDRRNRRRRN